MPPEKDIPILNPYQPIALALMLAVPINTEPKTEFPIPPTAAPINAPTNNALKIP